MKYVLRFIKECFTFLWFGGFMFSALNPIVILLAFMYHNHEKLFMSVEVLMIGITIVSYYIVNVISDYQMTHGLL